VAKCLEVSDGAGSLALMAQLSTAEGVLQELAADQHPPDAAWVEVVSAAARTWVRASEKLSVEDEQMYAMVQQQGGYMQWLRCWQPCRSVEAGASRLVPAPRPLPSAGRSLLPTATKLLAGMSAFLTGTQPGPGLGRDKLRALQGSAACCLHNLMSLTLTTTGAGRGVPAVPPAEQLRRTLPLLDLACILVHGAPASPPGTCSCCLPGGGGGGGRDGGLQPVLAFSRAATPLPEVHPSRDSPQQTLTLLHDIAAGLMGLQWWCWMDQQPQYQVTTTRLLASKGGLLLGLQFCALWLVQVRRQRAAGSRRSSIPGCADVAPFIGDPARIPDHPTSEPGAHSWQLQMAAAHLLRTLADSWMPAAPTCVRCAPQQLLLLVEAATLQPETTRHPAATATQTARVTLIAAGSVLQAMRALFYALSRNPMACMPFMPAFMKAAAPTLSAWVLETAQQLVPCSPASGRGPDAAAASCGADCGTCAACCALRTAYLAQAVAHAAAVVLAFPYGVLATPQLHRRLQAPVQELLAAAQLAMCTLPAELEEAEAASTRRAYTVTSSYMLQVGRGAGDMGQWQTPCDHPQLHSALRKAGCLPAGAVIRLNSSRCCMRLLAALLRWSLRELMP
jgi:hypothetical protein